jgi:predicted ATPase/class 3 adenylate cyclase/Tfp pilus assembly protein PilF
MPETYRPASVLSKEGADPDGHCAGDPFALLLTDVVDSTQLTERLGNAAAARLWTAHDRLARDLLPTYRGLEIDKTDGLLLLFPDAGDALDYAAAYHRALAGLSVPLQARAGLHVGRVVLRDNLAADVARGAKPVEVEGVAKATAARIMSLARPGQTLLSPTAKDGIEAPHRRFHSHAHWRLKGLAEPIELFEAHDTAAPSAPPADQPKAYRVVRDGDLWLPAREIAHALPAERDVFVGRRDALEALAQRFESGARLVSVTGIGGTGKTRLATRFAWTWLGEFPGGAWFCDLAQARSIEGIASAVGQALDVPLGQDDPIVQLGHAIAGRGRCLIVLDNFEQVARHAEATLGHWLGRARDARFLVTSRGVLGLGGESVLPLAPLGPGEASALFVERAQSAKPGFDPREADAAAIEPLVALLDGLPLAIELAAARVRVMPPRTLLARMSERFKLLSTTGGRADRQATLRATFDWSWELLSAAEKAALAQLSVFEGGFALEAAEAVLDLSVVDDPPWPLDVLQSLVEKSLVRQVRDDRFELLVSVQAYAAEHLRTPDRYVGSGPRAQRAAESRHAAWFAGLTEAQATAGRCVELENLVRAGRRAATHGESIAATQALEGAWAALKLRGPFKTAADLARDVGAVPSLPDALRARVERVEGRALEACGRVAEARKRYRSALALARAVGDRSCEGRLLSSLGNLDANEAQMEAAQQHLDAALWLAREAGDRLLECEVRNGLGTLNHYLGRIEAARGDYLAALAIARDLGDRHWQGGVLGNLGNLDASQGRLEAARAHFEAGLEVSRDLGNRKWEGNALSNLGLLHQLQGQLGEARSALQRALVVARELGHARLEAIVLCNLGIVDDAAGSLDEARDHYQAALVVARELGDRRSEGQFLGYLGTLHARCGRFAEARAALEAGAALLRQASDRLNLGVLLCGTAELEWRSGQRQAAFATLSQIEDIEEAVGSQGKSELSNALARVRALLSGRTVASPGGVTDC